MPHLHAFVGRGARRARHPPRHPRRAGFSRWRATARTRAGPRASSRATSERGNPPVEYRDARGRERPPVARATGGGEPDGPGADHGHVVIDVHSSGRPRARRGMRPAKPQLTRDSARLAAGLRSNSSSPKLRTSPKPRCVAAEQFHETVGETRDALRSSARQAANLPNNSPTSGHEIRTGPGLRQHLRERGRVAQPEIESLARHRVQCLRGVADEHHASGHGLLRARQRERIGSCDGRCESNGPRASRTQTSNSAAKAFSSSAISSAARVGAHRPDDGISAAGHRQHRERTRRT